MGCKEHDRTTYARILHHAKFSRGRGESGVLEGLTQGLKSTSIRGRDATDNSINGRELARFGAGNQRREGKYRNKHTME